MFLNILIKIMMGKFHYFNLKNVILNIFKIDNKYLKRLTKIRVNIFNFHNLSQQHLIINHFVINLFINLFFICLINKKMA